MVSAGIIPNIFVLYVMIIMVVILGLVWYTKTTYTRNNRDKTHWNRIVFPEDGKKPSTLPPTILNAVATSTAAACSASGSVTTKNTGTSGSKNTVTTKKSSWETDNSDTMYHGDWDPSMFEGQTRGFFTDPTDPGSAAARDPDGNLYGDSITYNSDGIITRKSDGRVGIWDTNGNFLKFDDVSNTDLNTRQGIDYTSINTGRVSAVPRATNPVQYCEENPGAFFPGGYAGDPLAGLPCKRVYCMANPTLSWKDPSTSVTLPCKTLFPNLN